MQTPESLFIHEVGHGPAVVLLHGSPSSVAFFEPLVTALQSHRRVLIPELPGYGQSPPLAGPRLFERTQELLEEALRARGVTQAAVVGFSLGSWRALRLALTGRLEVTQVVTLGGFAALAPEHRDALRATADMLQRMPDFTDPAFRRPVALNFMAPAFASAHPEAVSEVEAWLDSTTPAWLSIEALSTANVEDLHPRLGSLRAPLTARVGELDRSTPPAYSERMVAAAPHAVLQRVPGCAHALLLEDREGTVAALRAALDA
ncbi:MAG: alpha/beta fold hydrolase [Hyalangium sp.]|uniref:alpha/beta fold hydrolase n=1 Tax=Hyalangium sp. TaxID=2028555 RepID=UPI00389AA46D